MNTRQILLLAFTIFTWLVFNSKSRADDASMNNGAPHGYITIGKALNQPFKERHPPNNKEKSLPQEISETKIVINQLMSIKTNNEELNNLAFEIGLCLDKRLATYLQIIEKEYLAPSLKEELIQQYINGATGNVLSVFQRFKSTWDGANKISDLSGRFIFLDQLLCASSIQAQVLAQQYSGKDVKDAIKIDFDEQVHYPDTLCLYNQASCDLNNVTILDTLVGEKTQTQNIHFLELWPAKSWIYIRYTGSSTNGFQQSPETVAHVQEVKTKIWSDELSCQTEITYAGDLARDDMEEYYKDMKLNVECTPFVPGKLWNDYITLNVKMEDFPSIEDTTVTITFKKKGYEDFSRYWHIDKWTKDETKSFGDGYFKYYGTRWPWMPDSVCILINFTKPGTSYTKMYNFNFETE